MKKISFNNTFLFAAFLSLALDSSAQNPTLQTKPTKQDSAPVAQPTKQKSDNLTEKTLENSALIENIHGDMASLLLGAKAVSLMFDDKENDSIEKAVTSLKNNQAYKPEGDEGSDSDKQKESEEQKKDQDDFNRKSHIYLSSIMYYNPGSWAVWINDKKITSNDNKKTKEIYLKSVNPDQVAVLWNVSPTKLKVLLGKKADDLNFKLNDAGQIEVRFSLKPNQSFVLGSNSVIEGRIFNNTSTFNNSKDTSSAITQNQNDNQATENSTESQSN